MPQHRLDVADVAAAFEHVGGHRVAEGVAGAVLEAGEPHVALHHVAQAILLEGLAVVGHEERAVIGLEDQLGTHVGEVAIDPAASTLAQRHHAVFAALALAHHQRPALGVDVVELEPRELAPALLALAEVIEEAQPLVPELEAPISLRVRSD